MTELFTLYGVLYQKGNGRMITSRGGRLRSIKNPKVQAIVNDMLWQLKTRWKEELITEPCILTAYIYYPSKRHDLDDSLLCDILQGGTGKDRQPTVVKNDRLIEEKHLYYRKDKDNPRVEFKVELILDNIINI